MEEISDWMATNFLQLNREKTEILVVGTEAFRQQVCEYQESRSLKTSDRIKNLGVAMDTELSFKNQRLPFTNSETFRELEAFFAKLTQRNSCMRLS